MANPAPPPRANQPPLPPRALVVGLIAGFAYGVFARFTISGFSYFFTAVSLAFMAAVPLAMGVLTTRGRPRASHLYRVFAPWIPVLLTVAVSWIVGWEGAICVIMGLPIMLMMASAGGILGVWASRRPFALLVPALPFAVGIVESRFDAPESLRSVQTVITIDAPRAAVWANVVNVPPIGDRERGPALYTTIGFPAPVSAVLPDTGVGALREARFAGGVLFLETVTAWEPLRHLAFTVAAQTEVIPPSTLDPHVTVGGPYFDVLTGAYRLEPGPHDSVRLVLTSTFRLSTRFNLYASLWTDAIMRSIQRNILEVVRARAEAAS